MLVDQDHQFSTAVSTSVIIGRQRGMSIGHYHLIPQLRSLWLYVFDDVLDVSAVSAKRKRRERRERR